MGAVSDQTIKFGSISRFVLFGGGNLLARTAQKLRAEGKDVRVCTSPRHLDETPTAFDRTLRSLLGSMDVPLLEAEDVNACPELMAWLDVRTLGLGFGPAWIFGAPICAALERRFVNFMGIRMPSYMGGAHYTWQILRGNRIGAVNFQLIEPTLNTGPVVYSREYLFDPGSERPDDYFVVAGREELVAMNEFLRLVDAGASFTPRPLDKNFEVFYPYLNTEKHGWINWSWSAGDIVRFINAFGRPYMGASTTFRGRRVFLHEAVLDGEEGGFHPFQSGMIYRSNDIGAFIAAVGGTVLVRRVLDAEGRQLQARSLRQGSRFFTSIEQLEAAARFDARYGGGGLVTSE